LRQKHQLQAL